MMEHISMVWFAILGLGAGHGINPAMGWLFAVALGLQEGRRRAVWRSLVPLAAGHGLAIACAVVFAAALGLAIPLRWLKWLVALSLLALGVYRLFRHRHPRFGGMQVGFRDLTIWSFLMASAHGAGLMILPFVVGGIPLPAASHSMGGGTGAGHVLTAGVGGDGVVGLLVTLVHTAGYLLVTGVVAVLVYEHFGLKRLRSLWLNLDLIWAAALILTAIVTPLI